jgi:hypothetical protein
MKREDLGPLWYKIAYEVLVKKDPDVAEALGALDLVHAGIIMDAFEAEDGEDVDHG